MDEDEFELMLALIQVDQATLNIAVPPSLQGKVDLTPEQSRRLASRLLEVAREAEARQS